MEQVSKSIIGFDFGISGSVCPKQLSRCLANYAIKTFNGYASVDVSSSQNNFIACSPEGNTPFECSFQIYNHVHTAFVSATMNGSVPCGVSIYEMYVIARRSSVSSQLIPSQESRAHDTTKVFPSRPMDGITFYIACDAFQGNTGHAKFNFIDLIACSTAVSLQSLNPSLSFSRSRFRFSCSSKTTLIAVFDNIKYVIFSNSHVKHISVMLNQVRDFVPSFLCAMDGNSSISVTSEMILVPTYFSDYFGDAFFFSSVNIT